jgi:putative hemolysin
MGDYGTISILKQPSLALASAVFSALVLSACRTATGGPSLTAGPPTRAVLGGTNGSGERIRLEGTAQPKPAAASDVNPATAFCQQHGGVLETRSDTNGRSYTTCVFADRSECEEWAFYRGECRPGQIPRPEPTFTPLPTPPHLPTIAPASWQECCPSPDGKWRVRWVSAPTEVADDPSGWGSWYYRGQEVVSADKSVKHIVLDEWSNYGLGAPAPAVLGWTPDSRAVYVYEGGRGDGCDLFGWGDDLQRMEVATGKLTTVIDHMCAPSPAPDMSAVAYLRRNPITGASVILVQSLYSGKTVTGTLGFDASGLQAGDFVWSPEQDAVAFTFARKPCESQGIARFDLQTGKVSVLADEQAGSRGVRSWADEGTLVIEENALDYTATQAPPVVRRIDARSGAPRPQPGGPERTAGAGAWDRNIARGQARGPAPTHPAALDQTNGCRRA